MNRIEELEKELKLLREIEELKPKYESGWYKHKDNAFTSWLMYYSVELDTRYGFSTGGGWSTEFKNSNYIQEHGLIIATPEEVQTALIKEAKKRGFKEGVWFDNEKIYNHLKEPQKNKALGSIEYLNHKDGVLMQIKGNTFSNTIFYNGKWATIIDTPLTINSYEMKQEHDLITFGCARFDKNDLRDLNTQINYFNKEGSNPLKPYRKIKSITLDSDVTITVKQFQEIVDKIE